MVSYYCEILRFLRLTELSGKTTVEQKSILADRLGSLVSCGISAPFFIFRRSIGHKSINKIIFTILWRLKA